MEELTTKKILIAGASGFVGARAMQKYSHAIALPSALVREGGTALQDFVRLHRPNVLLNAAAISDIGTCEKNPDASYLANVQLPTVLAETASQVDAKFISFSTDQVYTGCLSSGPYREDEELPPPANLYARHKLEAEKRVLAICPDAVLLRATWMYDMPLYGHKNRGNFLVNTLNAIAKREKLRFSDDAYRGITYVRQVVELLEKAATLKGGVYNYGSENPLTVYQTAEALLRALGLGNLANELLERTEGHKPHNLWIDCSKIKAAGIFFDDTKEGLARCINDYRL